MIRKNLSIKHYICFNTCEPSGTGKGRPVPSSNVRLFEPRCLSVASVDQFTYQERMKKVGMARGQWRHTPFQQRWCGGARAATCHLGFFLSVASVDRITCQERRNGVGLAAWHIVRHWLNDVLGKMVQHEESRIQRCMS
jgi:hypothetical protein